MRCALALALAACGGDAPPAQTDAPPSGDSNQPHDAPAGAFTLASPMVPTGGDFPAVNTCTGPGDTSPQLVWTGDAVTPMSFAVTLTDPDANNLVHWAIYDIPSTATGLPPDVMKVYAPTNVSGAHQTDSYKAGMRGYLGPCPPARHTYRFDVYSLDVATLPGTSMTSTRADVVPLMQQHMRAHASFTASYQQP